MMKSVLMFIVFFIALDIVGAATLWTVFFVRAVIRRYKELEEKRKDDAD